MDILTLANAPLLAKGSLTHLCCTKAAEAHCSHHIRFFIFLDLSILSITISFLDAYSCLLL
jgi:hypothetical protein